MVNDHENHHELDSLLEQAMRKEMPFEVEANMRDRLATFARRLERGVTAVTPTARSRRRRHSGLRVAFLGVAAVIVAVIALARPALETWYIWQLESEDRNAREGAATKLGELRSTRAIPHLIAMLKHESVRQSEDTIVHVRRTRTRQTSLSLQMVAPPASVGRVIATWKSAELPASARALAAIGRPSVPHLVGAVETGDEAAQLTAAATLAAIGPSAAPALIEALDHRDPKVRELSAAALGVRGRVINHAGLPVSDATVFLAESREQNILNGHITRSIGWPIQSLAKRLLPPQQKTARGGQFVLRGAKEESNTVVVLTDFLHAWTQRVPDIREEITITLPDPARLILRYEVENDLPEAEIHANLDTWSEEGRQFGRIAQVAMVANGGEVVLENVTPGNYELTRHKSFRIGDYGVGRPLDRRYVSLVAGGTTVVEFVRREGTVIAGRVIGLPEGAVPGVFLHVEPATKTEQNRRLILDMLTCEPNGEFATARLPAGEILLVAEAYEVNARRNRGIVLRERRPQFTGSVKVSVPASGKLEPVAIEMQKPPR
jgi:hypothetical protein